jgi:hypothetical protein
MAEPRYKLVNGEYIELTAEEIKVLDDMRAEADLNFNHIRGERNALLSATDWTQIADAALGDHTVEEWATYRQELRDLPAGFSKVSEVVFPDDPPTAAAKAAEEAAA